MAGAGKSAVGKNAAEILGWRFVDLDKLILQTQGMSHDDYMNKNGEPALKKLEEDLTLGLDLNNTIYSPPGSMVYSDKAMQKIKQDSTVIYLQAEPATIEKRLGENLYKNGIIGLKEKGLAGVMSERIPLYEKYADKTFLTGDQTAKEMAQKIIDKLNLKAINEHVVS